MAFVTAREYVLSPLTRVSSSRRCSSNTRFVRFIDTAYSHAPGTAGVLAGPRGRRAAHRPLGILPLGGDVGVAWEKGGCPSGRHLFSHRPNARATPETKSVAGGTGRAICQSRIKRA